MSEIWKPVPGHDELEVSSWGRVRRTHILNPYAGPYLAISYAGGQPLTVHRLVATAFHGCSPGKGYEVDHINRNKHDNTPSNLRWVTSSENSLHGEDNAGAKLNVMQVRVIRRAAAFGCTERFLANLFGVAKATLHAAKRKQTWRTV